VTGNTGQKRKHEPIEVDGEEAKNAEYETTSAIGKNVSKSRNFSLRHAVLVFLVRVQELFGMPSCTKHRNRRLGPANPRRKARASKHLEVGNSKKQKS
jgi:hypothetical protein